MTAVWPPSLPQVIHVQDFNISFPVTAKRVDMETGPAFQRKQVTKAVQPFSAKMWVDEQQYTTLTNFYRNTLAMGSLEFGWINPLDQYEYIEDEYDTLFLIFNDGQGSYFWGDDPTKVRFDISSPWNLSPVAGDLYEVTMNLEIIP